MTSFAARMLMLYLGLGNLIGSIWFIKYTPYILLLSSFIWVVVLVLPKRFYESFLVYISYLFVATVNLIYVYYFTVGNESSFRIAVCGIASLYFFGLLIINAKKYIKRVV